MIRKFCANSHSLMCALCSRVSNCHRCAPCNCTSRSRRSFLPCLRVFDDFSPLALAHIAYTCTVKRSTYHSHLCYSLRAVGHSSLTSVVVRPQLLTSLVHQCELFSRVIGQPATGLWVPRQREGSLQLEYR